MGRTRVNRLLVMMAVVLGTQTIAGRAVAADGAAVPGFGTNGVVVEPASAFGATGISPVGVIDDIDGSLLVAGNLGTGPFTAFVARYTLQGVRDEGFGSHGIAFITGFHLISAPALLPDGTIVLATTNSSILGISSAGQVLGIINVPYGSTPDRGSAFSTQVVVSLPDGRVAVLSQTANSTNADLVSMMLPTGLFDPHYVGDGPVFNGGGRLSPVGGIVLPSGELVVAVTGTTGFQSQCLLLEFNSDGVLDPRFGGVGYVITGSSQYCGILGEPSGAVLAPDGPGSVRRYSPSGQPLGELPISTNLGVVQATVEGTGRIVYADGSHLAALQPNGSPDLSFTSSFDSTLASYFPAPHLSALRTGDIAMVGSSSSGALQLALISSPWGVAPQPPILPTTKFVPIAPVRVLDTRDGVGAPASKPSDGAEVDLRVAGVAGVPATGVEAVVLDVVATDSTAPGFVTVWPAGEPRPVISSLNLDGPGQTVANLVTVELGPTGSIALFTQSSANLVADLQGYYVDAAVSSDGRFVPALPTRILDTRIGLGSAAGQLGANGRVDVQVVGAAPVPSSGVSAVALNLTATNTGPGGYFTVFPTGEAVPLASSLNVGPGETRANMVIVPVGSGGKVSIVAQNGGDIIADVAGWFTDATTTPGVDGLFVPIAPTRVLDTRYYGPPLPAAGGGGLLIGSTQVVPAYEAAEAVVINATATATVAPGYFTWWPFGVAQPVVSNLNATRANETVPNAAIVPLQHEAIDLYTQSGGHLIVDVFGYYLSG